MDKDSRGARGARVLKAVAVLPGTVLGLVPALIVALSGRPLLRPWPWPLVAVLPAALGVSLMAWTIGLFARRGRGTLAPWDAPTRLVVAGPYRHVRNPMMVGVLLVAIGEATLLRAPLLWAWIGLAVVAISVLIPLVEEPRLLRRFGAEYERYRVAVPRWLPRLTSWRGDPCQNGAG